MLPLQPVDYPELPAEQEKRMLQDLQDDLTDYLADEMLDKLLDMAATIIEREGIDSHSDEGSDCLLYTSPSPRDVEESRMPSSA